MHSRDEQSEAYLKSIDLSYSCTPTKTDTTRILRDLFSHHGVATKKTFTLPSHVIFTGNNKSSNLLNILLLNTHHPNHHFSHLLTLEEIFIARASIPYRVEGALTTTTNGTKLSITDTYIDVNPDFLPNYIADNLQHMNASIILIFDHADAWLKHLKRIYPNLQSFICSYDNYSYNQDISMHKYYANMNYQGIVYDESRHVDKNLGEKIADKLLRDLEHKHYELQLEHTIEDAVHHHGEKTRTHHHKP